MSTLYGLGRLAGWTTVGYRLMSDEFDGIPGIVCGILGAIVFFVFGSVSGDTL